MKTIKLNNKNYKVAENENDIPYSRVVLFQQYFAMILQNLDYPLFVTLRDCISEALESKTPKYEISLALINFETSIKLKEEGIDSWIKCFCLICLEDNELMTNNDETFFKEKFKRLEENGLTTTLLKSEVVNFTKLFPIIFEVWKEREMRVLQIISNQKTVN